MRSKFLALVILLISPYLYSATPLISEATLIQIATNTLNSVRELNMIFRETRDFGENFERVYSRVETGIYKVERMQLWLEDMQELGAVDINSIDDFNSALSQLKYETTYLRKKLINAYREKKESEKRLEASRKAHRRSKRRINTYRSEAKASISPTMAAVETAKNTHDSKVELGRVNGKLDALTTEISKLTKAQKDQEQERIQMALENKRKFNLIEKGVLRKSDVRTR